MEIIGILEVALTVKHTDLTDDLTLSSFFNFKEMVEDLRKDESVFDTISRNNMKGKRYFDKIYRVVAAYYTLFYKNQ